MTIVAISFILFFFLSFFCSSAEIIFSSANSIRLENLAEEGSKTAKMALKVIDRFDSSLSGLLIGNNIANIGMSSLVPIVAINFGIEQYSALLTAALTLIVILFCEVTPKILGKNNANSLSLVYSYPVRAMTLLFAPIVFVVVKAVDIILLPMGKVAPDENEMAVEELQSIIEIAQDENILDESRSELLQSALEFYDVNAYEAMTARVDVEAIDIDDDIEDIKKKVEESAYSRIPVYRDSVDNIIGLLHQNPFPRLMLESEDIDIESLLLEPLYVYKTVKMLSLLSAFKQSQKQFAVVTDEYGGTLGIITIEDVLEQLVGEIWDESDEVEDEVIAHAEGIFEVDGDMNIYDFFELVDKDEGAIDFESDTVGGWIIERFGDFPKAGDSIEYENLRITVLESGPHRVEKALAELEDRPE
ncbi:MAG: HlyC/CorC family transporter [Clostridiales bacterium]|nr:HlyC/CorC family transporter [Clostridiales bacterium]